MGIQQGINTMLGTAGIAAAANKHLKDEHKRNVMTAMGFRNQFSNESHTILSEAEKLELDVEAMEKGYIGGDNVNEQMWEKGMNETNNSNDMYRKQKELLESRLTRLEEYQNEKLENQKVIENLYKKEFKQLDKEFDKAKGGIK